MHTNGKTSLYLNTHKWHMAQQEVTCSFLVEHPCEHFLEKDKDLEVIYAEVTTDKQALEPHPVRQGSSGS